MSDAFERAKALRRKVLGGAITMQERLTRTLALLAVTDRCSNTSLRG